MKLRRAKQYIALLGLLAAGATSCEVDNYVLEDCTLTGVIIDSETGEPFQAEIGGDLGVVRLYEQNLDYPSPTAQYIPIMEEGVFSKSLLPETSYKVDTYMCPLVLLDGDQVADLSPNDPAEVTLHCIPYLRIELSDIGNNQLYFTITRPAALWEYADRDGDGASDLDGAIGTIRICFGNYPRLSYVMCSEEMGTLLTVNLSEGTLLEDTEDEVYEFTFDMSSFNTYDEDYNLTEENLTDGNFYFRVSARITDADTDERNHSNIVHARFDSSLIGAESTEDEEETTDEI